jgi:hypothetical protein
MKKIMLVAFLIGIPLYGRSPVLIKEKLISTITITFNSAMKIVKEKEFDPMLYSFMKIESNFRTDVINWLGYGGILQLGQEMINDANRIAHTNYILEDRMDSCKSVEIWYIIQNHYNPHYTLTKACKVWNPTASSAYRKKIYQVMRGLKLSKSKH